MQDQASLDTLSHTVLERVIHRHHRVILAAVLLLGLFLRLPLLPLDFGASIDLTTFRSWARTIHNQGLVAIYDVPGVNYPPLLLYWFGTAAAISAHFPSPAADASLNALIKLPPVLANCLTALLIALYWSRLGSMRGILASAAYILNPGIWYVSAIWGQTESVYTLFLFSSIIAVE